MEVANENDQLGPKLRCNLINKRYYFENINSKIKVSKEEKKFLKIINLLIIC